MVVSGTAGLWKRSSSLGSGTGRDDSGAELRRTFFAAPALAYFFVSGFIPVRLLTNR